MHRFKLLVVCIGTVAIAMSSPTLAQQPGGLDPESLPGLTLTEKSQLRKLPVPAAHASSLATALSLRYQDVPNVSIAPDAKNQQLVVMAPPATQQQIASEVKSLLDQGGVRPDASLPASPFSVQLTNITWRQFERDLQQIGGPLTPVTTSDNGNRAAYQMVADAMSGTTVEVDRKHNIVTVRGPDPSIPGWRNMIRSLDTAPLTASDVTQIHRLVHAEPAPIQRAIRLLRSLEDRPGSRATGNSSIFRNAVFQTQAGGAGAAADGGAAGGEGSESAEVVIDGGTSEGGGVLGNVDIQFIPELGQIIIKGAKRDVDRVKGLIQEIEDKARLTQPDIEIVPLQHADCNAVSELLSQLYEDVLSSRLGDVSITSLDSPNSLLLIGRTEAIASLKDLIAKIDLPVEASSRLRVFRLQNASARDAEETIQGFFTSQPGSDEDNRPGLGARVRVLADYRTNSLIVSCSPRDMSEVTRLINELDVQQIAATSELKVFTLNNALAEDLAATLQDAINGTDEGGNDNITAPSTALTIVAVDSDQQRVVDSGVLAGATITADAGANAIVVRAPSASMPLIAELIRQLDKAPGIDSLVKVFTIENGDAAQLTQALQTLFGDDAGTSGTSVGAGNLAGLPGSTASSESSLVPLRFSTDVRTNSIVASGSSEDLEVVESILLRLDSEGFAERITEVIWLRNNDAQLIADAITNYVIERQGNQNAIQQYNAGLGPYDLPDRDIVAVPEINSNSILLSVSPRLYEEVRSLIDRLDRRRPMVLIKVLLAEVSLSDTFEFGAELGLQDSLVFNRGLAVADVPGTVAAGDPGFNFNNAGTTNTNTFARNTLGAAGVSTFGLGQTSPVTGYGGFVLNAASDSVSLLLRTLQEANRAQVLSRPEVMTMDNTTSVINIGRQIARFRGTTITNNATTQDIEDITIGLTLGIRPRVGADGVITVDVDVTRSDRDPASGTTVLDGNGNSFVIDDIVQTTAQSILSVYDGQTVIMGGLIQKNRSNISRRVPLLADIPLLGHLFRFDRETERRNELLIILTPTLISGGQDLEYVKQVESSRMSWCLADVVEAHGDVGLSGGYGLWGPAVGGVIYPDVNPTVENEVIISDVPMGSSPVLDNSTSVMQQPVGEIIYDSPASGLLESQEGVPSYTAPRSAPSVPSGPESLPTPITIPDVQALPPDNVLPPPNSSSGMRMPGNGIGQVSALMMPETGSPAVTPAPWMQSNPMQSSPAGGYPNVSGPRPIRLGTQN
ncbi:secretin N-terminal domain-containing protein [Stieleria varia]|uniref:Type II secretion system protein D n=1 Tax=Stieleria varia TaxID=2528005 RepID=A0A5C6B8Q7_9BACT|nr:secretin N-terminal domain-containing protein [Stieleria varia]TWU07636.1 Type II secretion system protein D precursor [Stieleria varia]